jgi:tRNA A-37 threonylcarbamoyl transferase component Bud32
MRSPARIGPYRIERLLGVGSFATVWLGHDSTLDARVAVKVLAENWSHDLRVRERFLEEGRMLWRLDNERLIRVHTVGETDDGRPYLVMDWAEHGSLRDRLTAGSMPAAEALFILRETAAGVAVLHENGIVHRDLTPGNVLFRPPVSVQKLDGPGSRRVVIADLGLAKAIAAASGLTARAGTPGFMAPEQDHPLATVDTRTDVYGLGRLGAVLFRDPVPPRLAQVLRTATAQRPADRYRDAAAFASALDRATAHHRGSQVPSRPSLRWRWAAAVLLALSTVAAMVGDGRGMAGTAYGSDSAGRITVGLPAGWRAAGSQWAGQRGPDGEPEPALVISTNPQRWPSDPAVPGAFVGLSRSLALRTTPARYVNEHPHAECAPGPVRNSRLGGVDWVIAAFTSCRTAKPAFVEAAGTAPDDAGLLYVQIAMPLGSGSDFVDALLGGISTRK